MRTCALGALLTMQAENTMKGKRAIQILLGIILLISAVSFAFAKPPALTNTNWKLTHINGKAVSTKAFLEFNKEITRLSGNAGCNRMFGSVDKRGSRLDIGAIGTTKMACADRNAMRIESEFTRTLSDVDRYRLSGNRLELLHGKRVVLRLNAKQDELKLEDKKWVVESLNGKAIEVKGSKPFISFDATKKSVGGDTGCNVFGGSYSTSKDTIKVSEIVSTMRACIEDDRMQVERDFMDVLQNANRYEIKKGTLYLHRKDKRVAVMKGEDK